MNAPPTERDQQEAADGGREGSWGGRLEAEVQGKGLTAVPKGITVSASPSRLLC